MKTIAKRIKEIRGTMTQKEFATRLGITPQAVINYEVHNRRPKGSVIQALCNVFGVNEAWLVDGEGPKHKEDLRRVTGLQELHFMQPIENTGVDTTKTYDASQVSELQRQITDLQGRLSIALGKGMDLQERLMTSTEQNANLRIQLERKDSRIRELERENAEIPALKARIAELERELSERPKLPKTVPVDVSAKSKPTSAHGTGTDTAVVPGTSAGVSGVGSLGAVVRNGE